MLHISPIDQTRRGFIESIGIPVSYEDAVKELYSSRPLAPICLSTFSGFGTLILCQNMDDITYVVNQPAKTHEWFLADYDRIPT